MLHHCAVIYEEKYFGWGKKKLFFDARHLALKPTFCASCFSLLTDWKCNNKRGDQKKNKRRRQSFSTMIRKTNTEGRFPVRLGSKQTNRNSVRIRDIWCGATGVTGKSYEARKQGRATECLNATDMAWQNKNKCHDHFVSAFRLFSISGDDMIEDNRSEV